MKDALLVVWFILTAIAFGVGCAVCYDLTATSPTALRATGLGSLFGSIASGICWMAVVSEESSERDETPDDDEE